MNTSITIPIRPSALRRYLILAGLGAVAAAGLATMPAARADGRISDTEGAYITAYGASAVCKTIDAYPTTAGVMGVMQGIMEDGFSGDSAVDIINASVDRYCDEHWPLLVAIGKAARGSDAYVA